jgi:WD40 repeat protein
MWDTLTGHCEARILTTTSSGTLRSLCVTPDHRIVVGCQDTTLKLYPVQWPTLTMVSPPTSFDQRGYGAVAAALPPPMSSLTPRSNSGSESHIAKWAMKDPPPILAATSQLSLGSNCCNAPSMNGAGSSWHFQVQGSNKEYAAAVVEPALVSGVDEGHCAAVQSVVHSRIYIVSAGGDSLIHVWRIQDLQHVCAMSGHQGPVFALIVVGVPLACTSGLESIHFARLECASFLNGL